MQILIKLSEDDYRKVQDGRASVSMMRKAIRNGAPLPKEHGRLIDADVLKTAFPCGESVRTECVRATIDYAPTIIEADRLEGEVGESE